MLILLLFISLSFPCSCLEPFPPEEAYEEADVVFSGEVTNMDLDNSSYYYEVTLQIIDVWKGEDLEEITVLTETYSDMCGYNFQINFEYLVYAYNYNGGIYTNICTRTNLLENAIEDLEFLNGLNNQNCEDIEQDYIDFHSSEYIECEYNVDCISVWGHCGDGLGECHYAVNASNYQEGQINDLVELWIENDCINGVCDCFDLPEAICFDEICKLAYCNGPNPAGCFQNGCSEGYQCIDDPNDCVSSFCDCDEVYGEWICTEDCGGGTCILIEILFGDLNFDTVINVSDIILLVNIILNPDDMYIPEMLQVADVNQDQSIDVLDIVMLVNIILS